MNRPRILIIDDDHRHRTMLKDILSPIEADVSEAAAGDDGLPRSAGSRPDLVIARLKASSWDGSNLCPLFNGDASRKDIPVILMGSAESAEHIQQGMTAGAFAYIDTNEATARLVPTVEKILKNPPVQPSEIKILVVDDSSSIRQLLQEELAAAGYRVLTAENGKKALEVLRDTLPDLILSDVYMPEMSGLELCATLHGNPLYAAIPFVVMSSESDAGNMRRMMRYGVAAFIIKPFKIEQLIMTLDKIVSYEFLLLLKEKERLDGEQKLLIAGIASLVKALEARDHYTCGHSERVSRILAGLVEHAGGTPGEVERAQIAGRLHDIGKIGIRDNVLLKPGALSDDEFDHIKQHPSIGAAIIQAIPSISDILPVVHSHHERMDGKGYPQGLKGSAIPLWARITAIADTYDALTSDRPYRKGMSHDRALDIIDNASATQLCPDCVHLFFAWCRQGKLGQ